MSTIRFQQRTDKPDAKGKCLIRLAYQIEGQKKYFPTGLKCIPENWDMNNQKAVYVDKQKAKKTVPGIPYENFLFESEVKPFNIKLNDLKKDIADIEERFRLDKAEYNPTMVMDALSDIRKPLEKRDTPKETGPAFVEHVPTFIEKFCKDSIATHKPGTLKVYRGLATHLQAYENLNKTKATFENLTFPFLKSFNAYLTHSKKDKKGAGMNNITAAKQMSTLKTLLNYARVEYKINVNPDYRDFKVSRNDSDFEVIALTNDEFLTLYNLDLSDNSRLDAVRDVLAFACASSLRYSDLAQLKWAHIRGGAIQMTAEKGTKKYTKKLNIPLNPYSAAILEKYKDRLNPLPIISNQKTNDYIKELCKLAKIDTPIEIVREYGVKRVSEFFPKHELISIHTGRKTFTTLTLQKGAAAQNVMKLTGHSTFRAFQRYINLTNTDAENTMEQTWGIVKENKLKAV